MTSITSREADAQRTWRLKQLKWSLQALQAAGAEQPTLFPDAIPTADDLAFNYDHWRDVVRSNYGDELSPAQNDALSTIDRKLATMSKDGTEFDVDLWTDAALATSEHWADIRRLATAALELFGWIGRGAGEDHKQE